MDRIGERLTGWTVGQMDLHHINTGRGNCTLCVLPDGTTLLIDAGEFQVEPTPEDIQRRTNVVPNALRAPWEWIVQYVESVITHRDPEFDYVWLTHFHSDHLGQVTEQGPVSDQGGYRLAGLTGVCDRIPFRKLIDRGWPDYDYPLSAEETRQTNVSHGREGFANTKLSEDNYQAFLAWHVASRGVEVERFLPGSSDQIRPVIGASDTFCFRNVVANGQLWTGNGTETRSLFPPVSEMTGMLPNENTCSAAGVIQLGEFKYFAGGDITGIVEMDKPTWFDVESHVADVVGPVDVAVMNHHGHRDTHNEHFVSVLKPRVWIGHSWSADHPGQGVFSRLTSRYLYPEDRDLFATNMMTANRAVIGPQLDQAYRSTQGHIVVRIDPDGEQYRVVIVDDQDETMMVKDVLDYKTSSKIETGMTDPLSGG